MQSTDGKGFNKRTLGGPFNQKTAKSQPTSLSIKTKIFQEKSKGTIKECLETTIYGNRKQPSNRKYLKSMIGVSVGNRKEKKEEKENPLGQNSDFQKFTTFSKNGIMQRFIRLWIGLGEIYAYTKFEPGGRKRKHTIGARKSGL